MIHKNLRELFERVENSNVPLSREPGTFGPATDVVPLEKDEGSTAYMISDGGESLMTLGLGTTILLPLSFYGSEKPDELERDTQARLAALIEACITRGHSEPDLPELHIDGVIEHLRERLSPRPLHALLANESLATILAAETDLKVYSYDGFDETTLVGLTFPRFVGQVITDPRPHADDPINEVDGVDRGWAARFRMGAVILGGSAVGANVRL